MAKLQRSTFSERKRATALKTRSGTQGAAVKRAVTRSVSTDRSATKAKRNNAAAPRLVPPAR